MTSWHLCWPMRFKPHKGLYYDMTNAVAKNNLIKGILKDLYFYDDGDLVNYFALFPGRKKGLRSNIVRVNVKSADPMISRRIFKLNELYKAIHAIHQVLKELPNNNGF